MTEVQVLDGMLDPNTHDEQGRLHGVVELEGKKYGTFVDKKERRWKLLVTYVHGQLQFPVKWLNPAGKVEMRSRSFWIDPEDGQRKPDGWTRFYFTSPYDIDSTITWEGFKGPSTPKEHLTYENGKEIIFRNYRTRNQEPRSRQTDPPPPDKWPLEWNPQPKIAKKKKGRQTISNNGVYKGWTSSNTSTT